MASDQPFGVELQLGRQQAYGDQYNVELLQPIARMLSRQQLQMPRFYGVDIWTGYELSWLNNQGKPQVAVAEFRVPAESLNIIESKSFKYYLNSFNQTHFNDAADVRQILAQDLSAAAGAVVRVDFFSPTTWAPAITQQQCVVVDNLPLTTTTYLPDASLLEVIANKPSQAQILCSHLLKTNCPVTGQPDWASVWVGYKGAEIVAESFLAYVVSYRQHQDFHEHCVEQIFADIWQQAKPEHLWVYARYTRRGGLDINPFRSSEPMAAPEMHGFRQ